MVDSRDFDILQWCEGMSTRLPLIYKCVRRTLSVPHTSCDVERSFSVWKHVRFDKLHNMQEGTKKAYGALLLVVPFFFISPVFVHFTPSPPISPIVRHVPPYFHFSHFSKPLRLVGKFGCG